MAEIKGKDVKMKKIKLKAILISALCLLCLFAATACEESYDPLKDGYTATVIYDFNGEQFDDIQSKTYRYKPDTPIIEPSTELNAVGLIAPSKKGYHISGWYTAETDENNEPIKVEGKYQLSEETWDFDSDRSGGENSLIYLVARWSKNYTFTVDVGEDARNAKVEDKVNTNYSKASGLSRPGIDPKWTGHTLYYYYYYEKDGKPVLKDEGGKKTRIYDSTWDTLVISDETPEITVYVEWLEGDWVIVTSASELGKYKVKSNKNYILDNDIDFNGSDFSGIQAFKGTFDGNGYTIKNFVHSESPSSGEEFGLFSFTGSGTVKNLTFENCTVSYSFSILPPSGKFSVAFMSANGGDVSRFADLNFVGCALNVSTSSRATDAEFNFGKGDTFGVFGKINDGTNIGYGDKGCDVAVYVDGTKQIER